MNKIFVVNKLLNYFSQKLFDLLSEDLLVQ